MAKDKLTFELIDIEEEPKRKYVKGSKYDPMIDAFIEKGVALSQIKVDKDDGSGLLDSNYLRTQLFKRIVARELNTVKALVINNVCYLKIVDESEATG